MEASKMEVSGIEVWGRVTTAVGGVEDMSKKKGILWWEVVENRR